MRGAVVWQLVGCREYVYGPRRAERVCLCVSDSRFAWEKFSYVSKEVLGNAKRTSRGGQSTAQRCAARATSTSVRFRASILRPAATDRPRAPRRAVRPHRAARARGERSKSECRLYTVPLKTVLSKLFTVVSGRAGAQNRRHPPPSPSRSPPPSDRPVSPCHRPCPTPEPPIRPQSPHASPADPQLA